MGDIGRISGNGVVAVAADAQQGQPLKKGVGRGLAVIAGEYYTAHIQTQCPEGINQTENIIVVGDAQIASNFILLNVRSVNSDYYFHIVLKLLQHTHLAVRLEARQYPGGVEVVKQLAAELQIELSAKLSDPLLDLFRLGNEIFLIVKADFENMKDLLSNLTQHTV